MSNDMFFRNDKHQLANLVLSLLKQIFETRLDQDVRFGLSQGPDLLGGTERGENTIDIDINDKEVCFAINGNGTLSIYCSDTDLEENTTETDVDKLLAIAKKISKERVPIE